MKMYVHICYKNVVVLCAKLSSSHSNIKFTFLNYKKTVFV